MSNIDVAMEQIGDAGNEVIRVTYNELPVYYISLEDGRISLVDYDINNIEDARAVTQLIDAGVEMETTRNRWVTVKII